MDKIKEIVEFARKIGIYPDIYKIDGASTNPEITVVNQEGNRQKVLMFSSNNYLGTANNDQVKKALTQAVEKYGMGSGGSRLVSGNIDIQEELESAIAKFKGYESAITFSTGYMANTGIIPALLNPPNIFPTEVVGGIISKMLGKNDSVVFSDTLNHASIVDGCKLAKSDRIIYNHKDLYDLEDKLKKNKNYKRKLIVSDGVFSMDGDIAPVKDIMKLADRYSCMVMIDDAHASGVLGANGKGTTEYFGLEKKPEIMMGTFTKAFGAVGGFVAGSKDIIDYLRVTARTYIFSAPIPPVIVAGILEALKVIEAERPFDKLKENINYIMPKLKSGGFNTMETETQIIPIVIGEEKKTKEVSRELLNRGIFTPAITWPAVSRGKGRLRITVMSTHTKENIDYLFSELLKVKTKYNF